MANVICGLSSVPFKCEHIPFTLSNREVNHPVFSIKQRNLIKLYKKYIRGELSDIEAYLVFLALLKSTEAVEFIVPAEITTSTPQIIANNIRQLVSVIWNTNSIVTPSFKQPRFFIRKDTATLDNVKIWINAWQKNIDDFKSGITIAAHRERLKHVENKLSKLIFTPETSDTRLASVCADWADTAAEFPAAKKEAWKLIIRKCYNLESMFATPKQDLIEIKDYCEENIEAGSIHYYTLMKVLRTGIANHNDFLGLGINTPDTGYTLVDEDSSVQETNLLSIIANAPTKEPNPNDYPSKIAYLRAKLAYKEAVKYNAVSNNPDNGDPINEL